MSIFDVRVKYCLHGNYVHAPSTSFLNISPSASLRNTKIYLSPGARLEIGDSAKITNAVICVEKGACVISECAIIGSSENEMTKIIINDGSLNIGDHAKLTLKRIWIRFGGQVTIGEYTNINCYSEIRCDESVAVGSYNQISHDVRIWDTNTHTILTKDERREVTKRFYPYFGYEASKPTTNPVIIGDDCWIGEKASILKGTKLGDEVIVGYNCFLTGQVIPSKSTVVSKSTLNISSRA